VPLIHRKTRDASLKVIRSGTRSQLSCDGQSFPNFSRLIGYEKMEMLSRVDNVKRTVYFSLYARPYMLSCKYIVYTCKIVESCLLSNTTRSRNHDAVTGVLGAAASRDRISEH